MGGVAQRKETRLERRTRVLGAYTTGQKDDRQTDRDKGPNTSGRQSIRAHHTTMDDPPDVATLVAGLVAESESARKYAVFKLQDLLADPSFADAFIQGDGLSALRSCVLDANGNAQAYALGSLVVLLELDMGWEVVDEVIVEKVSSLRGLCLLRG